MGRLKMHRFKYTSLLGRDRRSYSLQECLDNKRDIRRSYKNWIIVVLMLLCFHYIYQFFYVTAEYEVITETTPVVLVDPGDELLTTKKIVTTESVKIMKKSIQELSSFYKVDTILNFETTAKPGSAPLCITDKNTGPYQLNLSKIALGDLVSKLPALKPGGYFQPLNCTAKQKVAIVVAYRNRDKNLALFLANIHPFLMSQKQEYQIFIIEQAGKDVFNKGRLYNVGFKEVSRLKKFECIVFHDVDLLPMHQEIQYGCPTLPRHMSANINTTEIKKVGLDYKFESKFGGVVALTMEMITRTNGYSNVYFGWGGEDNDMLWRLRAVGYPIVRFNKSIGVYLVLPHVRAPTNEFRHHLLATGLERYKLDGLSNLEYNIISVSHFHLYTRIVVDINPRRENISMYYFTKKANKT